MKKRFVIIPFATLLMIGIVALATPKHNVLTKAESEVVEQVEQEETEIVEEEKEPTIDEFKEQVEDWLNQYMSESLVAKIIGWAVDAGVLGSLFIVFLKYRKYKHNTTDEVITAVKKEVGNYLKDCFAKLDENEIASIVKSFEKVENNMELLMKALVLAQSKTNDAKLAMLDLISKVNDTDETQRCIAQVKDEIVAEQKADEIVKEEVKGDYSPVE